MAGKRQQAARPLVQSDFAVVSTFNEDADIPAQAPENPAEWVVCQAATVSIPMCGATRFERGEHLRDRSLVDALTRAGIPVKAVA